MDVKSIGGGLKIVCLALPFFHSVRTVRSVMAGVSDNLVTDMLAVTGYMLGAFPFGSGIPQKYEEKLKNQKTASDLKNGSGLLFLIFTDSFICTF